MSRTPPIMNAPLRVLLVGAEPARALRADERVELVRVRSAVDAIAELASTRSDTGRAPVVALGENALDDHETHAFLAAAREADPIASIVLCRKDASRSLNGLAGEFDRVVDGQLTPDAVHSLTPRTAQPARAAATAPAGPSPRAPVDATLDAESADLEALLAGRDAAPSFLDSLRARLADASIAFTPSGAKPPHARASVVVERKGVAFGVLSSDRLDEAAMRDAAVWLSRRLALAEQMRQLRDAALTDPLTGAWNRRFFDRYLPQTLEDAKRRRLEAHLLVIDIDDFKRFNDKYGHGAGDEILRETVRLLKSVIRPCDRVCRLGGDEFAVVFYEPEGPRSAAGAAQSTLSLSKVTARFQRQICECRFPKLGHEAPEVLSISGGLATYPWDAIDAPTLLDKADRLALESKRAGKSVILFGPGAQGCKER